MRKLPSKVKLRPSLLLLTFCLILTVILPTQAAWRADGLLTTQDKEDKKDKKKDSDRAKQLEKLTAEQLAEVVILAYGGRAELQQVRTNGAEEGIIKLVTDSNEIEGKIERKFSRKDPMKDDLTRVDVELPDQKLTFGYNGFTVWAARDGNSFTPAPDAEASFLASLKHNYDALLRYREQGSTVERVGSDSLVGIDVEKLELTHKDGSKTRYFISTKTYRILHLEYELKLQPNAEPTKFRESFFDFRPIQNTLLPGKSMLYENGKLIQEIRITQTKFHTNLNEEIFLKF